MKDTLSPLPGVADVNIDFPNRLAHCKLKSEEFDPDKAIAALSEEGFEATVVEKTN